MASRNQRNTFLTGMLVTGSIVASVIVIVVLSGILDTLGTTTYTVRFELATNVGGLQPGAEVRVGGQRVGVVHAVDFRGENDSIEGIDVGIRVDSDLVLREDAIVFLELPLLGTQGVINFPSMGSGAVLPEDGVIDGSLAPPSFLAQAGFGDEERSQVQSILTNVDDFSQRLGPMGESAQAAVDDARAISESARTNWDNLWSGRIDTITGEVAAAAERAPKLAEDIQTRLDELEGLFASAKATIDDNREDIDTTVDNVRATTGEARAFSERLNGEITDRFMDLLKTGQEELVKAGDAVAKVGEVIDEERPNIMKSMANFRLASDQLRDTLVEVRRSPWRLLYRPDTRELQYELLYDAARSYAGALSDLRAASESLRVVSEVGAEGRPASDERMQLLLDNLDRAFEGYEEAESLFIERINEEAKRVGSADE